MFLKYFKNTLVIFICVISVSCLKKQNNIGEISPQKALEYMKEHKDIIIVDTATKQAFENIHFVNSINIPAFEMEKRLSEIPFGKRVLLHCRRGVSVKSAYETLIKNRSDLKETSFIMGTPLFKDYNDWFNIQNKE